MADDFDPYYQWLGISPKHQPPNHYRLLALEEFEENPDVIENAADKQLAHVRLFQSGRNSELSQKLLNEITAAKLCLLDPKKKADYDRKLRAEKEAAGGRTRGRAVRAVPLNPPASPAPSPAPARKPAAPAPQPQPESPLVVASKSTRSSRTTRRRNSSPVALGGAVVGVLIVAGLGYWAAGPNNSQTSQRNGGKTQGRVNGGELNPDHKTIIPTKKTGIPTKKTDEETGQAKTSVAKTEPPAKTPAKTPVETKTPGKEPMDPPTKLPPGNGGEKKKPPATATVAEIPPADALEKAGMTLRELFDVEIKAARTPQEKAALAVKLMTRAEGNDDVALKYALLQEALDTAVDAGEVDLAAKASEKLTGAFKIDAAESLMDVYTRLAAADLARENRQGLFESVVNAGLAAAGEEDFDTAEKLAALAVKSAVKLGTSERKKAGAVRNRLEQYRTWWEEAEAAKIVLQDNSGDPAANKALGKYLCFVKEDWKKGLPHLAKSDDVKLSAAAELELAKPETAAQQAAAGDAWWGLAVPAAAGWKLVLYQRAHHWYRQAVEDLQDPLKSSVAKRLATLEKALNESGAQVSSAVLVKMIVGDFFLTATSGRGKSTTTLAFSEDGKLFDNQQAVGSWQIKFGQVQISYDDAKQGTVRLRSRNKDEFTGRQTLGGGDTLNWTLSRVVIAAAWDVVHVIPFVGDSQPQRLVLYSNGKVNAPYGESTWSLSGNTLTLDWKEYRGAFGRTGIKGAYRIDPAGKTFSGREGRLRIRGQRVAPGAPQD